jgi:hypothetical protein
MRTITQALLALGIIGAMAVSTPNAAFAQSADLYIRGPGVGVDVEVGNRPYRYRDRDYRRYDRDRDDYYTYNRRSYYQRNYYDGNGYYGNGRAINPPSQY